jgi:hypothetical protein
MGVREGSSGPFVFDTVDVAFTSAAINANTGADQAVTVPGALVGDGITIEPLGVWDAGLTIPQGRCLVAGTVQMRTMNTTAGNITPAAQTYRFFLNHDRPTT